MSSLATRVAANLNLQRLSDCRGSLNELHDSLHTMERREMDEELSMRLAACRQEVLGLRDAYAHEHLRQSLLLSLALEE